MIVVGVWPTLRSSGYAVLAREGVGPLEFLQGETIRTIRDPEKSEPEDARIRTRQILVDVDTLLTRYAVDDPDVRLAAGAYWPRPHRELLELAARLADSQGRLAGLRGAARAEVAREARQIERRLRRAETAAHESEAPNRILGALQAVADYAIGRRVPFVEVSDLELRVGIGGKPTASRSAVRRLMAERWGRSHHEHVLDAAAVAVLVADRAARAAA